MLMQSYHSNGYAKSISSRESIQIFQLTCRALLALCGMEALILESMTPMYHDKEMITGAMFQITFQMLSRALYSMRFFVYSTFNILAGIESLDTLWDSADKWVQLTVGVLRHDVGIEKEKADRFLERFRAEFGDADDDQSDHDTPSDDRLAIMSPEDSATILQMDASFASYYELDPLNELDVKEWTPGPYSGSSIMDEDEDSEWDAEQLQVLEAYGIM